MKDDAVKNGSAETREAALYPYTSLAPSLKIADAVKELGGARNPVSKSSLAAHFNESEKSASLLQRISSAKAFGLIVGRSDYLLTESAKQFYSPTTDQQRAGALLNFLANPLSFREIIKLFDGEQLPKREILANIFSQKLKVPESWKERAAAFFENSAQFVGVIDENRFLRFKLAQIAARVERPPPSIGEANRDIGHTLQRPVFAGGGPAVFTDQEEHSLFLDKEKTRKFTINSPLFVSRAEYERICKWIEVTLIVEDEKKEEGQ